MRCIVGLLFTVVDSEQAAYSDAHFNEFSAAFNKDRVGPRQCDQIWRFFGLWATFIDIWRFLSGHTGAGPLIQELAFTKSMFSLLKKIDKIDTVTLLQAMEKYM